MHTEMNGLDCAACGHDQIVVETDGRATCPNCHRSYSLVVHEEFALMERDGWATRIALDAPEELASNVANG